MVFLEQSYEFKGHPVGAMPPFLGVWAEFPMAPLYLTTCAPSHNLGFKVLSSLTPPPLSPSTQLKKPSQNTLITDLFFFPPLIILLSTWQGVALAVLGRPGMDVQTTQDVCLPSQQSGQGIFELLGTLWGFGVFLRVVLSELPLFDLCTKPWVTEILFIFHWRGQLLSQM